MTNPYRVRNSARDLGTWPSREEVLALGAELDERYNVDHGDVELVRAAIARWGNPTPQPPVDGEVAELVAWLLSSAVQAADANHPRAAGMLTWAAQVIDEQAELLERLTNDNAGLVAAADSLWADNISLLDGEVAE